MLFETKVNAPASLILFMLLLFPGIATAQEEIIELTFSQSSEANSDTARTLQSLVKVQGKHGLQQDGLYLLTHYGDREELFEQENLKAIEEPMIGQSWRYCSVFTASTDSSVFLGRNWDNQNVGSIIISLYQPPDGYKSISFSRAIDLDFPLHIDLEQIKSTDLGDRLLLAPFYAMDGMNEHGLAVAVTGVRQVTVGPVGGKQLVFVPYLIRKLLDQAKSVEEAVRLARQYIPFDLDQTSLNSHLLICDSTGRSVILEYLPGGWQATYGKRSWQTLTNKRITDASADDLREACWRYRSMSESLEPADGVMNWKSGMKILHDVQQKGTAWSALYSPTAGEVYFSVYQNWDKNYHLIIP